MSKKTYNDGYSDMATRLQGVVAPGSFTKESLAGMLKCLDATRVRIEHEMRSMLRNEEARIEHTALDIAQELAPDRGFHRPDVTCMYSYDGDKRVDEGWEITLAAEDEDLDVTLNPNPSDEDIRAAITAALK